MLNNKAFTQWIEDNQEEYDKSMKSIQEQIKKKFPGAAPSLLQNDVYSRTVLKVKLKRIGAL